MLGQAQTGVSWKYKCFCVDILSVRVSPGGQLMYVHVQLLCDIVCTEFQTVMKYNIYNVLYTKKVKRTRNRPGVAQTVPGGLGSQIS
jgi:hypothetical protein